MTDDNNQLKDDFFNLFEEVRPIVLKAMHTIHIKLWTADDYFQEGQITLHELLEANCPKEKLFIHFKVKYRQKLINIVRGAQAQKRYWDNAVCLDVYETESYLQCPQSNPEDSLIFDSLTKELFSRLTPNYRRLLRKQLTGGGLTRMERYRLKEKIKAILYDLDQYE